MPDRAVLHVTVEGEGAARDEAYETAARSAKAVDDVIDRLGDAVERVTHTALVVHPKTRWRKGETVRTGWRASRSTSLEVVDLARLGDLIAEVAMSGGEISGPNWQIDTDNPPTCWPGGRRHRTLARGRRTTPRPSVWSWAQ